MRVWQFINDGRHSASLNMKKDLEIFEDVSQGRLTGSLRIYNWDDPAITLGFHQKFFSLSNKNLNISIIRRPTGGGAVLHYNDITFSICTRADKILPGNIDECSRIIAEIFKSAFEECNIDTYMNYNKHKLSTACFERSSPAELLISDQKIMGLAIAKKKDFLLVQGDIPLKINIDLSLQVFGPESNLPTMGILDYYPNFSDVFFTDCICSKFSSHLGIHFSSCNKE